jgi:hypothetical protein
VPLPSLKVLNIRRIVSTSAAVGARVANGKDNSISQLLGGGKLASVSQHVQLAGRPLWRLYRQKTILGVAARSPDLFQPQSSPTSVSQLTFTLLRALLAFVGELLPDVR